MTISPSSSAQAAREVVAQRLRGLRKGAGLTGDLDAGGPPVVPPATAGQLHDRDVYSSSLVRGLLQTEGYTAAVLGMSARFRELPVDDSAEAARARVERSRIIH